MLLEMQLIAFSYQLSASNHQPIAISQSQQLVIQWKN
jgi:hypothetical protein